MNAVRVTAFPRVHFGLLDLAHATRRKYGGVGVVLDWPVYEIAVTRSESLSFEGFNALDETAQDELREVTKRFLVANGVSQCKVELCSSPPQHVGLGSKTALTLAILAGVNECLSLGRSAVALQRASGRGAVSGIGTHGFFSGGLIVDVGQPQDGRPHVPSAAAITTEPSLLQMRVALPECWVFYLLLPNGIHYSGLQERELFSRQTPIPAAEAYEAISLVYHGIVPSLITGELEPLRMALRRFGQVGFKAREIAAQTEETRELLANLNALESCAVGMSSVGPLVFAISNLERGGVETDVRAACLESGATLVRACKVRNEGHSIRWNAK